MNFYTANGAGHSYGQYTVSQGGNGNTTETIKNNLGVEVGTVTISPDNKVTVTYRGEDGILRIEHYAYDAKTDKVTTKDGNSDPYVPYIHIADNIYVSLLPDKRTSSLGLHRLHVITTDKTYDESDSVQGVGNLLDLSQVSGPSGGSHVEGSYQVGQLDDSLTTWKRDDFGFMSDDSDTRMINRYHDSIDPNETWDDINRKSGENLAN